MEEQFKPRISVIVPVYKVEAYLPKCIDSLVKQTYKDLEIILVDDGSPDSCPALCDQAHSEYPSLVKVIHKENGGVMSARRAGVAAATGEYIAFVDGDDYVEPDMYEFLYDLIQAHDADIAQCGLYSDDNGAITTTADGAVHTYTGEAVLRAYIMGGPDWIAVYNKLYPRELFLKEKLDFDLKIAEDRLTNYCLLRNVRKIVFCNEAKYAYVTRPNSAMRRPYPVEWLTGDMTCCRYIMEEQKDTGLFVYAKAAYLTSCLVHLMYILYTGLNTEYYDGLMSEVRHNIPFLIKNRRLFRRADRIKAVLLLTNKRLAKWVYTRHRDQ